MHIPSHSVHTKAHCTLCSLKPNIQCTSSAHTAGAITSSVHTLQQPLHLQCTLQPCTAICSQSSVHTAAMYTHVQLSAANLQCTLQPTAAIYKHLHCSYSIQCTLQLYYPVHTAAILSSAHCSYTIQCTLQLFYPVHTVAILSSAHCSYSIQCTLQIHYLYSTSSAPLNHHRVSLYHYWHTSRAVSRH